MTSTLPLLSTVALSLGLASCVGVQTGDGGDSGGDCAWKPPVSASFDEAPVGATEVPRTTLAPLSAVVSGVVEDESGDGHTVDVTFVLDEASLLVLYPEGDPVEPACDRIELLVEGTATIEGGDFVGGTVPASARAIGDQIWIQLDASALTRKPATTFGPEATLAIPLQLGLDCRWSGRWRYFAPISCEGKELCSGYGADEVGSFSAEGTCHNDRRTPSGSRSPRRA